MAEEVGTTKKVFDIERDPFVFHALPNMSFGRDGGGCSVLDIEFDDSDDKDVCRHFITMCWLYATITISFNHNSFHSFSINIALRKMVNVCLLKSSSEQIF